MAQLTITLRDGGGRIDLDTDKTSAQRIFNRYVAFLKQGAQPSHKFPLDGADAGSLALDFANVLVMHVSND